jgi:hypothetical protein
MGGTITLHSKAGQGSRFTLHLPLRLASESKPVAEKPSLRSAPARFQHRCAFWWWKTIP